MVADSHHPAQRLAQTGSAYDVVAKRPVCDLIAPPCSTPRPRVEIAGNRRHTRHRPRHAAAKRFDWQSSSSWIRIDRGVDAPPGSDRVEDGPPRRLRHLLDVDPIERVQRGGGRRCARLNRGHSGGHDHATFLALRQMKTARTGHQGPSVRAVRLRAETARGDSARIAARKARSDCRSYGYCLRLRPQRTPALPYLRRGLRRRGCGIAGPTTGSYPAGGSRRRRCGSRSRSQRCGC